MHSFTNLSFTNIVFISPVIWSICFVLSVNVFVVIVCSVLYM